MDRSIENSIVYMVCLCVDFETKNGDVQPITVQETKSTICAY